MDDRAVAESLCSQLREVYQNRLRAVSTPTGQWIVAIPQPTLEGGDVALFVEAHSQSVTLHDNRQTVQFLQGLGIDPTHSHRRHELELIASARRCEYAVGRLQVVARPSGLVQNALGLIDCIKTVSDLGLRPIPRFRRQRAVAARIRPKLFSWYERSAISEAPRVTGANDQHYADFLVRRGPYWCLVKVIEGRNPPKIAAEWLANWLDIRLAHPVNGSQDALAGAVSVYVAGAMTDPQARWTREILGATTDNVPAPADDDSALRATIGRVLSGEFVRPVLVSG